METCASGPDRFPRPAAPFALSGTKPSNPSCYAPESNASSEPRQEPAARIRKPTAEFATCVLNLFSPLNSRLGVRRWAFDVFRETRRLFFVPAGALLKSMGDLQNSRFIQ